MRVLFLFLFLAAGVVPAAAAESIYRCVSESGVVFQGVPCPGEGAPFDPGALSVAPSPDVDIDVSGLFGSPEPDPVPARREVAGVACPSLDAIEAAVDAGRVALCMTSQEVEAAAPARAERILWHRRMLPSGPSVVEWVYRPDVERWPTVVRFRRNRVIAFSDALPEYYSGRLRRLRLRY